MFNIDVSDIMKQSEIAQLTHELEKANYAYYNTPNKIMSDEEYDTKCRRYKQLTGNIFKTTTPPPKGKRVVNVKHGFENLLGTIDNKFQNMEELSSWLQTQFSDLGCKEIELLISEKYDGNSTAIEYENGKAKIALTRGDDGEGADLTDIFSNQELLVDDDNYIGIRYEVMISYENFNKLNSFKEQLGDKVYVNPRSTVAGILGSNDAIKYKDYLTLVPLALRIKDKELTRYEELELLEKYQKPGDIDFTGMLISGNYNEIISQINDIYNEYIEKRENLNYMIDGLVIEFMDEELKKKCGRFANGSPKWSAALKFPHLEKTSTITDFVFEVSENGTGKITPSAIYEPVKFNGATCVKTSLANYKRFKELQLGIGSKVIIEYHNDVLSYISPLDIPENKNVTPYEFTKVCPCCGAPITINENETFAYCSNLYCESKIIGKINQYVKSVGMKGIEYTTLKKLYDAGLIKTAADLYRLRYNQIVNLDGFGELSAENIISTIKENKPNDYDVIAGLGINNLGRATAKEILKEFKFEDICDESYIKTDNFKKRLSNVDGIGKEMLERVPKALLENNSLLYDLSSNIHNMKETKRFKTSEAQLIFVLTGDPDKKIFKTREEEVAFIEEHGHKVTGSVSKKTNYLVTETPNSGTVKNKKAQELGVKIITTQELVDMLY